MQPYLRSLLLPHFVLTGCDKVGGNSKKTSKQPGCVTGTPFVTSSRLRGPVSGRLQRSTSLELAATGNREGIALVLHNDDLTHRNHPQHVVMSSACAWTCLVSRSQPFPLRLANFISSHFLSPTSLPGKPPLESCSGFDGGYLVCLNIALSCAPQYTVENKERKR